MKNTPNKHAQLNDALQSSSNYYPWVVILLCAGFLFYKYLLQVSPSVMTDELMSHFHVNGAGLGNLAATFFYSYLVVQLFAGALLDRFSPRLLTSVAILASALGALLFAAAHSLLEAGLARSLIGVGAAFGTVSYMKMAAMWFKPEKFAVVSGLLATAAMLGSMAAQTPMAFLVSTVGWHVSLYFCGVLGLALTALFYLIVRDKQRPSTKQNLERPGLKQMLGLLKHKHNWLLTFYSGLAFAPLAVFGGLWGNPFLIANFHMSKTSASSLTTLMFLGLAAGGPLTAVLSNRIGKRYAMMRLGLLLSLVTLSLALYVPDLPVFVEGLLLLAFGFGTGAFMLGFTVSKEVNSVLLAATVVSLINTGDALFGAFSEPLVGKLLDVFWQGKVVNGAHQFSVHDFHLSFALLPFYLLLALLCLRGLKNKIQ